jgi:hypothetical protein
VLCCAAARAVNDDDDLRKQRTSVCTCISERATWLNREMVSVRAGLAPLRSYQKLKKVHILQFRLANLEFGVRLHAVGGDVWAAGKAAGSRRPGWWLPAVGSGPERGRHIGYVRRGLGLRGLEARRPTVEAGETAVERSGGGAAGAGWWRRWGHQTRTG